MHDVELAEEIRRNGKLLFTVDFRDGTYNEYYLYNGKFYQIDESNWARDQDHVPSVWEVSLDYVLAEFRYSWYNEKVDVRFGCE